MHQKVKYLPIKNSVESRKQTVESRKQTACDEIGHINNGLNMTKS